MNVNVIVFVSVFNKPKEQGPRKFGQEPRPKTWPENMQMNTWRRWVWVMMYFHRTCYGNIYA
jgi:hypothetical protein